MNAQSSVNSSRFSYRTEYFNLPSRAITLVTHIAQQIFQRLSNAKQNLNEQTISEFWVMTVLVTGAAAFWNPAGLVTMALSAYVAHVVLGYEPKLEALSILHDHLTRPCVNDRRVFITHISYWWPCLHQILKRLPGIGLFATVFDHLMTTLILMTIGACAYRTYHEPPRIPPISRGEHEKNISEEPLPGSPEAVQLQVSTHLLPSNSPLRFGLSAAVILGTAVFTGHILAMVTGVLAELILRPSGAGTKGLDLLKNILGEKRHDALRLSLGALFLTWTLLHLGYPLLGIYSAALLWVMRPVVELVTILVASCTMQALDTSLPRWGDAALHTRSPACNALSPSSPPASGVLASRGSPLHSS